METDPKERSDLLTSNKKYLEGSERRSSGSQPSKDPPDGGVRALMVMMGSFVTNGLIFGIVNSYSVVYIVLSDSLMKQNVPNPEVKAWKNSDITQMSGILKSSSGEGNSVDGNPTY